MLEGYRSRFLPSAARTGIQSRYGQRPNWDVLGEVLSDGYEALWIHGYAHANAWLATGGAALRGPRVLIREEQTLLHGRPWYVRALKETALRALFARTYGLYIGEQNRRYFLRYGLDDDRLFPAPYCVDNDYFRRRAEELRPRRDELRARYRDRGRRPGRAVRRQAHSEEGAARAAGGVRARARAAAGVRCCSSARASCGRSSRRPRARTCTWPGS